MREKIESVTVRYKDGKFETFEGDGTIHIWVSRLEQRKAEGAPSNKPRWIKQLQVHCNLGDAPEPKS